MTKRYTTEEKAQILKKFRVGNLSTEEFAALYDIDPRAISEWDRSASYPSWLSEDTGSLLTAASDHSHFRQLEDQSIAEEPDKLNSCQAFEILTAITPELKERWEKHIVDEYGSYDEYQDNKLDYIDIGVFVQFLKEKYLENDTEIFYLFFSELEKIIRHANSYTKELMVVGLLEGLQNSCGEDIDYYNAFHKWMLSKTRGHWNELIKYWEGSDGYERIDAGNRE